MRRLAGGELELRRPDGGLLPPAPTLPAVAADAAETLRAQNSGLPLDPPTLTPTWSGDRLDVGYAIDVMHPRAIGY